MIQKPKPESFIVTWLCGARVQYIFAAAAAAIMLVFLTSCWPDESWEQTEVSLQQLSSYLNSTAPLSQETVRKVGAAIDPELMARVPTEFSPKYKSPCWFGTKKKNSPPVRQCLPYLYIMGAFHSGCQSLQQKLSVHPRVVQGRISSAHFWSEDKVSADKYLGFVEEVLPQVQQNPQEMVILDAAQSYFSFYWAEAERTHREYRHVMLPCWNNCTHFFSKKRDTLACLKTTCYPMARSADRFLADDMDIPYRMQHTPLLFRAAYSGHRHPRFVVVLRDPVERLYSAYYRYMHYKQQYGHRQKGFNNYVSEQLRSFYRCARKHGAVDCVLYFETHGLDEEGTFFHADQLLRGAYSVYVEFWLKYFPREHFLFIKAEDYFTKTNETLATVLDHVGLSKPPAKLWANMVKGYVPPKVPSPKMDARIRDRLRAFYAPFNKRLAELLGPEFTW